EGRYSLHELMRQYGEERLKVVSDAKKDTQYRHCIYYAGFLHQHQATLRSLRPAIALDEIETELDNIREIWHWAVEHEMQREIQQSMHSLYVFCHIRAQGVEGQRLFDMAVERFEHEDSAMLAYLLLARNGFLGLNRRECNLNELNRAMRLAY